MKRKLSALTPPQVAQRSREACRKLMERPEFHDAGAVMLYMPLPGEVDTAELALTAWQQQKTVLLPKVSWEQRHMMAVKCLSFEDEFSVGRHGIREPAAGEPWPVARIDLVVVPALAYDRTGHRLGHGAGFYDRFLSLPELHAAACGLAFDEQVVEEVPVHDHDCPLDFLVTDKEVLTFPPRIGRR